MLRKWKWLIIEVVSIVALAIGWHRLSPIDDASVWAVFAIIFGTYVAGYAAARLDEKMTGLLIHVGVKNWKPYITMVPKKS